jgi:hypothetical protein
VAFRRAEVDEVPSAKCFGFVQTYDRKPASTLWEVMKSPGMQENRQVVFMSDGGEDVRRVQEVCYAKISSLLETPNLGCAGLLPAKLQRSLSARKRP